MEKKDFKFYIKKGHNYFYKNLGVCTPPRPHRTHTHTVAGPWGGLARQPLRHNVFVIFLQVVNDAFP